MMASVGWMIVGRVALLETHVARTVENCSSHDSSLPFTAIPYHVSVPRFLVDNFTLIHR